MGHITAVPIIVVLAASTIAAITDVWKFKIYNLLTVPLLLSGLVYHAVTAGWAGLIASSFGLLLGFAAFFVPFLLGIMGAGDVKLMAALGAWLGGPATSTVILIGCIITVVYSVLILAFRGGMYKVWQSFQLSCCRVQAVIRHMAPDDEYEAVQSIAQKQGQRARLIPFSVMISLGLVIALLFLRSS